MRHRLSTLFLTFLKIGAFTFGGGYAMIAMLENEFIGKKHWIEREEFLDMVAIAESTPGPVAINSATYIGYKLAGFWGALVSTVAVSLPSFCIIYLISLFFDRFLSLTYVSYAFRGIQAGVIYLILSAGLRMLKGLQRDKMSVGILAVVFLLSVFFTLRAVDFSSIWFILCSGLVGLLACALKGKDGEEA